MSEASPLHNARRHRLLAVALTFVMVAGCSTDQPSSPPGASATTPATPGSSSAASPGSIASGAPIGSPPLLTIPSPPSPAARPGGTVDEQAAALAAAVGPSGQQALAPLLAAYGAAGLPVIGADGNSVSGTVDDPIGPPWWLVWVSAGGNPSVRMSLADAAKLTTSSTDTFAPDPVALAAALLADLRDMASDQDAHRRFFARFVASSAATGGADPLNPAATADAVMLNSIGITFLLSGLLREAMVGLVAAQPVAFLTLGGQLASRTNLPPIREIPAADPAPNPCNPTGTAEDMSFWTQWIASKVAAGAQLPGMEAATRSAVSLIVKNAGTVDKIGKGAGWASAVIAAMLFAAQMSALTAEVDVPSGLVRTHSAAYDKEQATMTVTIKLDLEGSLLDGGQSVKNCLLVFLNALGIQASLPTDGPIAGATVIVNGKQGLGNYWHFPNASELEQDTGQDGTVRIQVEGRHQKQQISQDAPEWDREASLSVAATPEAVNARSIASTFWDSFVARSGGAAGLVGPVIDVMKTIRWDLGVHSFLVIDWSRGWFVDQASGGGRITGLHCDDLGGQWVIHGTYVRHDVLTQKGVEIWAVTIDPNTKQGTYTYTDTATMEAPGGTVYVDGKASGEASVDLMSDGKVSMRLKDTKHTFNSHTDLGGHGVDRPVALQLNIIIWETGGDCD